MTPAENPNETERNGPEVRRGTTEISPPIPVLSPASTVSPNASQKFSTCRV